MANTNLLQLPVAVSVSGNEWVPLQGVGGTTQRAQISQFNLTGNTAGTTQTANIIFAGPASGAAAFPTFRAQVPADLPGNAISAFVVGDLLVASSATALASLPGVVAGRLLASGGVGVAPAYSATPTLGASGTLGSITLGNATSGLLTLRPVAGALGTVTVSLPAATDTLVGKATTDTFTNKTYDTAGTGNSFLINGLAATANTGTGAVVRATSPTLTTPALGTPSAGILTNCTGYPGSAISGPVPLTLGGTNASLTASNGGIFYSTASAGAILAGTATANQILLSGSSATPAWSTAVYPATTSAGRILASLTANTVTASANPVLGAVGTTGTLGFSGTTSGTATITPQATSGTPTLTLPNASGTFAVSASSPLALSATTGNLTITGAAGQVLAGATPAFTATPTLGASGTLGSLTLGNATSGLLTLRPVTGALGTVTVSLPAATDTLVGKATTDTLTNKTFNTAGAGNVLQINGTDITAVTGTGAVVLATSAAIVTPAITAPTLAAGTTTVQPLKFTSGVLNTTPVAGVVEFDGVQKYSTIDTTSGRGAIPVEQYFHLTAAGATISTIANFFGANSNISLVANAYYIIDIEMFYLKTTAGTVTWTLTNSAAPTSQNIYYQMSPATGLVAPPGTATMLVGQAYNDTTAARAYTTGSLTSAVNHYAYFRIWLQNGTGTSLLIQATTSAGTITPGTNSYWRCRRISPNNIGTFAA